MVSSTYVYLLTLKLGLWHKNFESTHHPLPLVLGKVTIGIFNGKKSYQKQTCCHVTVPTTTIKNILRITSNCLCCCGLIPYKIIKKKVLNLIIYINIIRWYIVFAQNRFLIQWFIIELKSNTPITITNLTFTVQRSGRYSFFYPLFF